MRCRYCGARGKRGDLEANGCKSCGAKQDRTENIRGDLVSLLSGYKEGELTLFGVQPEEMTKEELICIVHYLAKRCDMGSYIFMGIDNGG